MSLLLILIIGLLVGYGFPRLLQWISEQDESRRREEWLEVIEPTLRVSEGYPEDWSRRRKEVFLRANGRCECCGKETGKLRETTSSGMPFIEPQLRGAHVHHIEKISEGGDHSLSNLQLLCEDCHSLKHPDREILGMINMGLTQGRKNHKRPRVQKIGTSFQTKVRVIKSAIEKGRILHFSYRKFSGEQSSRSIRPENLEEIGKSLCVSGFCYLRNEKRTFAIKRMENLKVVESIADPERDSTLE